MKAKGKVDSAATMGVMIQQGRLVRGITQRELADELGISQRQVWEMESGKRTLFSDRLFAMLRATGVHLVAELELPDREPRSTGDTDE